MKIGDESRECLPPSATTVSATVAPGAELVVQFGVKDPDANPVRFRITAKSPTKQKTLYVGLVMAQGDHDDGWRRARVALGEFAGETTRFRFDTDSPTRDEFGRTPDPAWTVPRLVTPRAPTSPPNVVLVSLDTLRADHLACYGYRRPTSPSIDRMASEGVRFAQAVAPASWTLPSHASMLTGLTPQHHGAVDQGCRTPLPPDVTTLAEGLQRSGYRTAAFVGGYYVSERTGLARGFDQWVESLDIRTPFQSVVDRAIAWTGGRPDEPYFLFLHTYAVHLPYTPKPPHGTMFTDPAYAGPYRHEFTVQNARALPDEPLDPADVRQLAGLYDGEIRQVDDAVGRLLEWARESGPTAPCILLVSDHGEEFQEHGALMHPTRHLYEELVRVPMIAWCPERFARGAVVSTPVSLLDVAPTLLAVAGAPPLPGLDGVDLSRTITRNATPPARGPMILQNLTLAASFVTAVRTDRYKLIRSFVDSRPVDELYDLVDDPAERRNLEPAAPAVLASLRERLLAVESDQRARARAAAETPVDETTREQLRSLGYVVN